MIILSPIILLLWINTDFGRKIKNRKYLINSNAEYIKEYFSSIKKWAVINKYPISTKSSKCGILKQLNFSFKSWLYNLLFQSNTTFMNFPPYIQQHFPSSQNSHRKSFLKALAAFLLEEQQGALILPFSQKEYFAAHKEI